MNKKFSFSSVIGIVLLGVIEGVRELPVNVFLQLTKYLATLLMGAGILDVNSSEAFD